MVPTSKLRSDPHEVDKKQHVCRLVQNVIHRIDMLHNALGIGKRNSAGEASFYCDTADNEILVHIYPSKPLREQSHTNEVPDDIDVFRL